MKRKIALLLTGAMLVSLCAGCGSTEETTMTMKEGLDSKTMLAPYLDQVESMTSKDVPFYAMEKKNQSEATLYFFNGQEDIPYVNGEALASLVMDINQMCGDGKDDFTLTAEEAEGVMVLSRENGAVVSVDPQENTIFFTDYDLFNASSGAANTLDVISTQGTESEPYLLRHTSLFLREGDPTLISLSDYQIQAVEWEKDCYIPLQTAVDVFGLNYLLYNGESLVLTDALQKIDTEAGEMKQTEMGEIYYSVKQAEKSEALAQYTYNELCLALDHLYGLKEQHNITSFDRLFIQTGLWEKLLSTDASDTYSAIETLTLNCFADGHSSAVGESARIDQNSQTENQTEDSVEKLLSEDNQYGIGTMLNNYFKYLFARTAYYPDGVPGYEEVGNTAYITFDKFVIDPERDYYNTEITDSAKDTVNLLLYANQQLHREGCPIENVVIDLTYNGGGDSDAAMCVAAWFLGNARFSLESTLTETQSTMAYAFDANLDREFDADTDSVRSMNRYCLISPNSFSCGNLVPAAFKASNDVTLIGQTSGGGACVVLPMTTADGNQFTISGSIQVNTVTNGSYYDVDQGVAPDFTISDIRHFYDRQYMTDFINDLP